MVFVNYASRNKFCCCGRYINENMMKEISRSQMLFCICNSGRRPLRVHRRAHTGFVPILHVMLRFYPRRSLLGLILMAATGLLFAQGLLSAFGQTALWTLIFFFISAAVLGAMSMRCVPCPGEVQITAMDLALLVLVALAWQDHVSLRFPAKETTIMENQRETLATGASTTILSSWISPTGEEKPPYGTRFAAPAALFNEIPR